MIASMTAFSHQTTQTSWGILTWELRTVNHRFLDVSLRLPENLRVLEPTIREKISSTLQRGKIEAHLKFTPAPESPVHLVLSMGLVKELSEKCRLIQSYFPAARINLLEVLSWPGALNAEMVHQDALHQAVVELLLSTLQDLQEMRFKEGAQIKTFIAQRLQSIQQIVESVEKEMPRLLTAQQERLQKRLAELNLSLDLQRLEQEVVLLIQKSDIAEEIQRLKSHCHAMLETISAKGAHGRRLDFLAQELNREANTMSSKALAISISQAGIELKVLIEQIREQVQNIE
jgi:uncharacterized protein (TIGR00255 family)